MAKPQDVLVLLKLDAHRDERWTYSRMSAELGISQGEIVNSVKRAAKSGLLQSTDFRPVQAALFEFLVHGLKYVFPAERGGAFAGCRPRAPRLR